MVDRQHRAGGKTGKGMLANEAEANLQLRDLQKKIALEKIDLNKDPYFTRNHIGTYECRLCLTIHTNEGSYLSHTQAKKHQTNLQRRQAKDVSQSIANFAQNKKSIIKKKIQKIGKPGYKIVKAKDPETQQKSINFEIDYLQIDNGINPKYRIMSSFEQKVDVSKEKDNYQFLLFAAEPYETVGFRIPKMEIDTDPSKFNNYWDNETKKFSLNIAFKEKK